MKEEFKPLECFPEHSEVFIVFPTFTVFKKYQKLNEGSAGMTNRKDTKTYFLIQLYMYEWEGNIRWQDWDSVIESNSIKKIRGCFANYLRDGHRDNDYYKKVLGLGL